MKDLFQSTSTETLPSGPNSPLPKLPLSSPSLVTSGVAATPTEQPTQPSSLVTTPSSPPKNPKPFSSKSKMKGTGVGSPPRYSPENAYYNYFFEFENENLFEKFITHGFILERHMKLDSFRVVAVHKLMEDRSWGSTISNIP